MAWQTRPDGTTDCDICGKSFRRPRSCACPHDATRAPGEVRLGSMESMTAQAKALGMLDRLGLEKHLADRVAQGDRRARLYIARMKRCLQKGVEKMGLDGPVDGDADASAVKWAALAEQASGRADKVARALYAVVRDREERADMERQERLAADLRDNKGRPQTQAERGAN